MSQYATGTEVSVVRSIAEMDKMLKIHGATGFAFGRDDATSRVMFRIADRMVRFDVQQPDWHEFTRTPTGRARTQIDAQKLAEAEERRRWRALVLVVKALLIAVADGVMTLSDAFLANTVLPGGVTVGEWAAPQLDVAYATAQMPELMPGAVPQRLALPVGEQP